jgi:hypothetical protein
MEEEHQNNSGIDVGISWEELTFLCRENNDTKRLSICLLSDLHARTALGYAVGAENDDVCFFVAFQQMLRGSRNKMPRSIIGNAKVIARIKQFKWEGELLSDKITLLDEYPREDINRKSKIELFFLRMKLNPVYVSYNQLIKLGINIPFNGWGKN